MMVTMTSTAVTRWPSQGHMPPRLRSRVSVLSAMSARLSQDEAGGLEGERAERQRRHEHADPEDGLVPPDPHADVHEQDAHTVERVVQHGRHQHEIEEHAVSYTH